MQACPENSDSPQLSKAPELKNKPASMIARHEAKLVAVASTSNKSPPRGSFVFSGDYCPKDPVTQQFGTWDLGNNNCGALYLQVYLQRYDRRTCRGVIGLAP